MTLADSGSAARIIGRALRLAMALATSLAIVACGGAGDTGPPKFAALLKTATTSFSGNGYYWSPVESGTGFFFEAQGGVGVVTFYMYEESGRPVWYAGQGTVRTIGIDRAEFQGQLLRFSKPAASANDGAVAPVGTPMGNVSVVFNGTSAEATLPTRKFYATRYFDPRDTTPAARTQPETGIYWNPGQNGLGYTIEVGANASTSKAGNGLMFLGVFHYDADGEPTWHLVPANYRKDTFDYALGPYTSFRGGQTLAGAYKAPRQDTSPGTFYAMFDHPCQGTLLAPDLVPTPVSRFAFGSLPPGAECRELTASPRSPGAMSPVPSVIMSDVQIALAASQPKLQGRSIQGGSVNGYFQFQLAGNAEALSARKIYVVVEDPDSFFSRSAPSISYDPETMLAALKLGALPFMSAGRMTGALRFFVCLDAACGEQVSGSPVVVPYDIDIRAGFKIAPSLVLPVTFGPGEKSRFITLSVTIPAYSTSTVGVGSPMPWQADGSGSNKSSAWIIPKGTESQTRDFEIQVFKEFSNGAEISFNTYVTSEGVLLPSYASQSMIVLVRP